MSHAWLELRHGYGSPWFPDSLLAVLAAWLLWIWWPRKAVMPALLRVLFLGWWILLPRVRPKCLKLLAIVYHPFDSLLASNFR